MGLKNLLNRFSSGHRNQPAGQGGGGIACWQQKCRLPGLLRMWTGMLQVLSSSNHPMEVSLLLNLELTQRARQTVLQHSTRRCRAWECGVAQ